MAIGGVAENVKAATEIQRTIDATESFNQSNLLFDPVFSATDLVSISDGSVKTGEGWGVEIKAIKTDDSMITIHERSPISGGEIPLKDATSNGFSGFPESDIKGLFFDAGPLSGIGITLPVGTILTFAVIPEPATALVMGLGLLVFSSSQLRNRLKR